MKTNDKIEYIYLKIQTEILNRENENGHEKLISSE